MKRERCHIHQALPRIDVFPASADGERVAVIVQCPQCLNAQVHMYGQDFAAVHGSALTAWNEYQQRMVASGQGAAA